MARRSILTNLIVGMAREAARSRRYAEAQRRQQARNQARAALAAQRAAVLATKQAKHRYLEQRVLEVEELNSELAERNKELRAILSNSIPVSATAIFESMRIHPPPPLFQPPPALAQRQNPPLRQNYLAKVSAPSIFAQLFPRARAKYERAFREAEQGYKNALAAYEAAERDGKSKLLDAQAAHERAVIAYHQETQHRDSQVDALLAACRNSQTDAVTSFAELVLEQSIYPEDFPRAHRLAYVAESKQLMLEYQLPPPNVVPTVQEYRYNKSKDTIEQKQLRTNDRKELYQDIIASLALRNLFELFASDDADAIQVLAFSGYIRTVDPATGRDIQPHLISLRVTKQRFQEIDLQRVDKLVCLRNLGAQVSPRPYEVQPIKPVIDFDMVDKRFVEQHDILTNLESRPNLMDLTPTEFEELVANLFQKNGIEAKLTRSHRDGGVDVVGFDSREILGGKVVIQAKRYRHTVGVSAVRDLFGTMQHEGANKGILVSTAGYGPDAYDFAQNKPMQLIDGAELLYLLQQQGIDARIDFPEDHTQTFATV